VAAPGSRKQGAPARLRTAGEKTTLFSNFTPEEIKMKRAQKLAARAAKALSRLHPALYVAAVIIAGLAAASYAEKAAASRAEADADALCANGNWTKVKAEREEGRDYYVVTVRSDNPAVGETQVLAFPWYDSRDASLIEMSDGAHFAFERTAPRRYNGRHVTSNYVAAKPIG
jgi:hypothetical protein